MATEQLPDPLDTSDYEKPPSVKKRKYRKHPKPDPHAPKKPSPSAYHLFALEQGNRLRKAGYGFEDIARETGALWRALPPQAVSDLESMTTQAKNQYRKDVSSYKKGPHYREYQEYLKRWMAKEEAKKKRADVLANASSKRSNSPLRRDSITTNPLSPVSTASISSNPDALPSFDLTSSNSPDSSTASFPLNRQDLEHASKLSRKTNLPEPDSQIDSPDDWLQSHTLGTTIPLSMRMSLPLELSTREQLEWKWSAADFDATLAPDPLFPLHNMTRSANPTQNQLSPSFTNYKDSNNILDFLPYSNDNFLQTSSPWLSSSSFSTISPSMLTTDDEMNANSVLSGTNYALNFGTDPAFLRKEQRCYDVNSAAC